MPLSEFWVVKYKMEASELFSVKGLVAVVTGGGSGMYLISSFIVI